MVQRHIFIPMVLAALTLPALSSPRASSPPPQQKDYLTEAEADKIRDAVTPSEKIKLFLSFAEDRLKKFEYELNRSTPQRHRRDILNSLMNAYAGCMDDAADQIAVAQEKQMDIRVALKMMRSKGKEFLDTLEKVDKGAPGFDAYQDTLEDAIQGTKDALADAEQAEKEMLPPPVRRKP